MNSPSPIIIITHFIISNKRTLPGAPNENIVQKHLNIADKVIFLFPKNFSSVRIS